MAVELNHTLVAAHDQAASASFLTQILGLPEASRYGPFLVVDLANHLSLDVMQVDGDIAPQHYAFLVSEGEFDEIFGRIQASGLSYWADPAQRHAGEINRHDGGRGVYFEDPNGHLLEIITRPYGGGA
jgi:catechol 2,3-dioxygenase-like lactoylglutathione lyase family enzyme